MNPDYDEPEADGPQDLPPAEEPAETAEPWAPTLIPESDDDDT